VWNKETFGNIFAQKSEISEALKRMEEEVESSGLTIDLKDKEKSLLSKYHNLEAKAEAYWKKNSRVQWLKEGDRNTKFFHLSAFVHKNRNSIGEIEDEK
ncbi:hypothetical protein KI387_041493, partial [Taxus chinensis]